MIGDFFEIKKSIMRCLVIYLETRVFIKLVAPAGIEPATQGFSVPCSTD